MSNIEKRNNKIHKLMGSLDLSFDTDSAKLELEKKTEAERIEILNFVHEEFLEFCVPPLDIIKTLKSKYKCSALLASVLVQEAHEDLKGSLDLQARFSQTINVLDRQIAEVMRAQKQMDESGEEGLLSTIDIVNTITPLLQQKAKLLESGMKLNVFSEQLKSKKDKEEVNPFEGLSLEELERLNNGI